VASLDVIPDNNTINVLDHGFVRLDDAMADDLSVVNGARVSFARSKTEMDESDEALIRFLMRDRHGSPFEHNAFRFHIRCPIFVAREWFRHRIGCLTGDTVVTFVNSEGDAAAHLQKTVDELWQMWNEGERDGYALNTPAGHRRVRHMRLRVLDERTGEFTIGHVEEVIDQGAQPVYKLALADGKEITVTENHRLLTSDGWKPMREAVGLVGDTESARMTAPCSLLVNGVLVRPRLEAKTIAKAEASTPRGFVLTAHPVGVDSVTYLGVRQTYDLSVAGPWHNFVANGIVVHNSFNEFSMRYAKATDDFYVPEPEDVRTQVGKPGAYTFEPVEDELAERTREELRTVYEQSYAAYERLVEAGVARELARAALPVGAYTQFYWTVNARALMNFISLRNSEFAQLEIRRYGESVEAFFAEKMPVTYAAFLANNRVAP
jgi:thymidylate synthase ThyX